MVLLFGLLALSSLIWGAASFVSSPSLVLGCALVACWLVAFAVRERLARRAAR
ncbi:hypothetical protein [Streptacidiphilus sp. EB129]|uniref:hypothetical protein n=1 Tax=Streptacidiphilus sp. EB129 TaxID=3156262 RepID=UPI0035191B2D